MDELLSDDEMARWVAWKKATSAVMDAVVADITAATGLSSADFSVLTRVVEIGGGAIRQQRLSDELDWERSRLSRHVARMEQRGLVRREGDTAERRVAVTAAGRDLAERARLVHAAAVRQHLLRTTPGGATSPFWQAITELGSRSS